MLALAFSVGDSIGAPIMGGGTGASLRADP